MLIKKIELQFKSWFITPLDSDTLLSYIFSLYFEKLSDIFQLFLDRKTIPFIFSNGFESQTLPKPLLFPSKQSDQSLITTLSQEKTRKKMKSQTTIFCNTSDLWSLLNGEIISTFPENGEYRGIELKNKILRFGMGETDPYITHNIKYNPNSYTIYVKIYNNDAFERFFHFFQHSLLNLWYGKAKSRGYGKVAKCECLNLTENEQAFFDFHTKLKEKWIYYVLNNYKIDKSEFSLFDFWKSNYTLYSKHTKSLQWTIFKWEQKFIQAGSILYAYHPIEKKVLGDYYQHEQSFNFWYLF